jgi:hypothetical protein
MEDRMFKVVFCGCALAGCLGLLTVPASGQEVVHALIGTVNSIDNPSKTITLFRDNGSQEQFKDSTSGKTRIVIDKKIAFDTTPADNFKSKGAYVIVFYYGDNDDRTAVALKNLGAGPFSSTVGSVVRYEGKSHSVSVKDQTGAVQTFRLTDQTVAEGYMGATDGYKFQAQKGDQIRIVASTESGTPTALFIHAM